MLDNEQRLTVVVEFIYWDDIQSAMDVGLVCAGRLRQAVTGIGTRAKMPGHLI